MKQLVKFIKRCLVLIPGTIWVKHHVVDPLMGGEIRFPITRPRNRGPAPEVDRGKLQDEYRQSPVSSDPDTFVLYRIIGNDLYPRHRKGQCRENLEFILKHEANFPDCEKRFVVNRIVDPDEERQVIGLLEGAGMPYLHIPFRWEEYANASWDVEGVPPRYSVFGRVYPRMREAHRDRARMRLYRHKNNYVMNNNGARNAALNDGRKRAKWVLPWDGNCFLTAEGWEEIRRGVIENPEVPYHIVPMARINDNSELMQPDFRPPADEEPQILFRSDTRLEFDREYPYGRRPKVEMFWRLGIPGTWDGWHIEPWDLPCPEYASDAGKWMRSGWVVRLSSGKPELETGDASLNHRGVARVEAITAMLDRLDEILLAQRMDPARPVFINAEAEDSPLAQILRPSLLRVADEALQRGPYSVVDKTTLPPSGNPHDYWHPAPYFWPHPLRIPGLPYVRRDGRRIPGTVMYEPLSDRYDRTRLQRMFDDTFVLALAFRESGDARYGDHAANLVRHWFLDPETAMNPHLDYAQVRRGHNRNKGSNSGIIEMKDLCYFLDAVRLLVHGSALAPAEQDAFRLWLQRYLAWLHESEQGPRERASSNNHGTYYDLQVASIAAFLGDYPLLLKTLRDSRARIVQQFARDGSQPEEMERNTTAHYCCFNLQGWIYLAELADACGEDLWGFEGSSGQSIRKGMEWLLPHIGQAWPYRQIDAFDDERFFPIYYAYRARFGDSVPVDSVPSIERIKPLFHPHDGIRPFWQLR